MCEPKTNCLVIGIGNEFQSDDSIGILMSRMLRKKLPATIKVAECNGGGVELLEIWEDYNNVFIIDAASSGKAPGTILRFDLNKETLPQNAFNYSSHSFSISETVELARKLNRLPTRLIIYGIEGKIFEQGTGLSYSFESVCDALLKNLLTDIQ
ncbi:MAG: hydrogenase maturation protease [Bacteroidetes bacterium]|nr:hydrogenase maturation protease [Bacteroidota bacterium]